MTYSQMDLLNHAVHGFMSENLTNALNALRAGKIILLLDAHDRENEGDLIVAAEKITAESMNFLIKHGSGIVCLPMPKARLEQLGLPAMLPENTNSFQTAFTVSIEARRGVTTGVSAKDRAHTIQTAMADDAKASDLARPGHVFPLAAVEGGVFSRMGHTEGSVDLMRLAGLKAGAVLCELMNEDGSMTIGEDRQAFAKKFSIPMVSVEEVLFYRMATEQVCQQTSKNTSTRFGHLSWHSFSFAHQIVVEVFHQATNLDTSRPLTIKLVQGEHLKNRYMAQILAPSSDDPLFSALSSLQAGTADLVVMTSGDISATRPHDAKSMMHAVVCRTLQELSVTQVSPSGINEELAQVMPYFSLRLVS